MAISRRTLLSNLALASGGPLLSRVGLAQVLRTQAAIRADPLRPLYHLMPERGWMNDPCGPIFWKGQYHMFFQYNPHAAVWGDMHWAHAVSSDMVRWRHLPVALAPTPGGADADGCFTGSAVVKDGVPTILYTGVRKASREEATLRDGNSNLKEVQMLATSTDPMLREWKKVAEPVIPSPPPGMAITGFRDPAPFRMDDTWYTVVASGVVGKGGNVLLYRSADLHVWEYLHPLAEGTWSGKAGTNPVDTGEMWECPDFFPLDDRWVLIHSTEGKTIWQVGDLDRTAMRFKATGEGLLNDGPYYAPKTQQDAHGRRILWGWIPETCPVWEYRDRGWAGCMSLPRMLTVRGDQLCMEPAAEVKALRRPGTGKSTGFQDETVLHFNSESTEELSFMVRTSNRMSVLQLASSSDMDRSTIYLNGDPHKLGAPIGDETEIRIFMDHSVVELFLDRRYAFTRRFYHNNSAENDGPLLRILLPGKRKLARQERFALASI